MLTTPPHRTQRTRRLTLGPVAAVVACLTLSCSSSSDADSSGGGPDPLPRISDEQAASGRAACEFGAGALPHETLGKSDPLGDSIPIEHIFVLMMENRSFDHYFSKLPEYGQPDVKVADSSYQNPDLAGADVAWHHAGKERYCVRDPDHGWNGSHEQYGGGNNDGFVITNEPDGARAMAYFDQTDLPFYYELANTFAISDTYYSSLLGPTWPNRMYLYSGSSHSLTQNTLPSASGTPNIFQSMMDNQVSWIVYRSNYTPAAMFVDTWLEAVRGCPDACPYKDIEALFSDLAEGNLPEVTYIAPEMVTGIYETSEHPPGNIHYGQRFLWQVVTALTQSPIWEKSALFITYDEHGGFADHVAPPPACHPGTGDPEGVSGSFDRYGFRVPVFVVSPYAKRHYVSHVTYDHTSILRFIQAKHGIGAYSNRDANAAAMMDMFDFDNPPFSTPPTFPEPAVDAEAVTLCEQQFPGGG